MTVPSMVAINFSRSPLMANASAAHTVSVLPRALDLRFGYELLPYRRRQQADLEFYRQDVETFRRNAVGSVLTQMLSP